MHRCGQQVRPLPDEGKFRLIVGLAAFTGLVLQFIPFEVRAEPARLEPAGRYSLPDLPGATRIAIAAGRDGSAAVLFGNPPRILVFPPASPGDTIPAREVEIPSSQSFSGSGDIVCDGGLSYLVFLPGNNQVYRYNLRGESLPLISLPSGHDPLSGIRFDDGALLYLNRLDARLWLFDASGESRPFSATALSEIVPPVKLELVSGTGRAMLLAGNTLWWIDRRSGRVRKMAWLSPAGVEQIAAEDNGNWVAYSPDGKSYYSKGESSGGWQQLDVVEPLKTQIADIALRGDRLYLLPRSSGDIEIFRLQP